MTRALLATAVGAATVSAGAGTAYLKETFGSDWKDRWIESAWKKADGTNGKWVESAGEVFHDAELDKGIKTGEDARFFGISTSFEPFSNKDKELVIQYQMKHEQEINCGGGYIKVGPKPDDLTEFGDPTEYYIMFGPDQCGSTKRIHVILNYKGQNVLRTQDLSWTPTVGQTHLLTLVLRSDNSYEVLVDQVSKAKGALTDDFKFLPDKQIKDPEQSKPKDWVDEAMIDDPEDKKPDDWDAPERIVDPEATMPEDWDEEEDGEWEAPTIANPDFKGVWKAKRIDNPDYKGPWEHPLIDNPEYADDDTIYAFDEIAFAGFDLWQVKGGTLFDNIYVGDNYDDAKDFAQGTWVPLQKAEKEATAAADKKKAEEEAAKKAKEEDDEDDLDLDDEEL